MTIETRDQLIFGLANNNSRMVVDKASISSVAAGNFVSLWRATGQPGQGAIPGAAAVCNNALTGAMVFTQQAAPASSFLGYANMLSGNSAMTCELTDRLMHMGGLSGTSTAAQTVGIDLSANLGTSNLDARKGAADYREVQWWLEWYTATGGTAVTATVNVTYNDGTSGNLTAVSLAATRPASFAQPLNGFIPAADSGKNIRAVNSVTLSATTGTAGSFGVTACRSLASLPLPLANKAEVFDWAQLRLAEVPNGACVFPIMLTSTTTTGVLRGFATAAHG